MHLYVGLSENIGERWINSNDKICNDAKYKIKSWNYDTFIRYGGIILPPPPYMQLFWYLLC